jgi:hypothetical protein
MKKEEIDSLIKDKLIDLTEDLTIENAINEYFYNHTFDDPDYCILDDLEDYLYDRANSDSEIIYYDDAWEILKYNFEEACSYAADIGYTLRNITLTSLASIYNYELTLSEYLSDLYNIKDEFEEFLDKLTEKIEENEEEDDNEE